MYQFGSYSGSRLWGKRMYAHLLLQEHQNCNYLLDNQEQDDAGTQQNKISHLQRQRRSHSEMVGRKAAITIKLNPMPAEWVTYKLENNNTKVVLFTVVKILNPMSGFPAWGSDKGTGNPQRIWPWSQQDLIIGFPQDRGKRRLQSWRTQTKSCARKNPEEKSSDPTGDWTKVTC